MSPILFSQKRMGYKKKFFTMFKLRIMFIDKTGTEFTNERDDPRITNIGKIIRKFRIDELVKSEIRDNKIDDLLDDDLLDDDFFG